MLINKPGGADDMYQFSYTFAATDIGNEEIYNEVGKPVVESVLDGYNGTVLAYGQTGSGAVMGSWVLVAVCSLPPTDRNISQADAYGQTTAPLRRRLISSSQIVSIATFFMGL